MDWTAFVQEIDTVMNNTLPPTNTHTGYKMFVNELLLSQQINTTDQEVT